jgi:hypothetical protein
MYGPWRVRPMTMTLLKYRFSDGERRLVVEALRAAADRFNILADDLEEDRDNPSKVAAYVSNRMKSEDCLRLAGEIEKDVIPPHLRRGGKPHTAHPYFRDSD